MIELFYIFAFVFGLLIGSFLNVCIYRVPNGESISRPPSHCPKCGTRLTPLDLVPILSYIFLRGKCRYCSVKISIRYPAIELLTGLTFLSLFYKYGENARYVEFFAAAYLMAILIVVFFVDYDRRIIPNELVVTGLVGGAILTVYNIFYPVSMYGDRQWWNPLLGVVTGSGFLLLVAMIGYKIYKTDDALGLGDVKLFAAIGIFLGWKMTVLALFMSVFIGGFMSLILLVFRLKKRKDTVPFGPFIVLGTYITLMWGWDLYNYWYLS